VFQTAAEVSYDNSTSGLAATTVQAALDEIDGLVDTNTTDIGTNTTDIGTNTTDISTNAGAIALRAPIASPTFTGIPAGPTAAPGDSTTQFATTEFVTASAEIQANANGVYRQLGDGTIEQWGVTTTDGGASVTSALLPVAVTSKVIAICSSSSHNPGSSTSSKAGATLDGAANIIEVFTDSTLSAGVMWYLLGTV
jgi:hypothetical protein